MHIDQMDVRTTRLLNAISGTRVLALAQGPAGHNLSLVVDFEDGEDVLDQIHSAIINSD